MKDPKACVKCGVSFDLHKRDVSEWPMIDDEDASDHCRTCWFKFSEKKGGRPLGGLKSLKRPKFRPSTGI
jgi:hypothetical protein